MLTKFIPDGCIKVPLESPIDPEVTKQCVIKELVGLLPSSADASLRGHILKAVLHREEQMSTGIGDGVAIPHGTAPIDRDLVIAAGLAPAPGVDFAAIDRKPARLFFLLVAKQGQRTTHLQALALIARLMKSADVHEQLLGARDASAFREIMVAAERAPA